MNGQTTYRQEGRTANEQFCKSWGEVQNSTVVLLFNSCAKLNFSASISQPSQSCQTVSGNATGDTANINDRQTNSTIFLDTPFLVLDTSCE